MPANGPDSGVEDTHSVTVDIDGAMDALKNLIVFPVGGSKLDWRKLDLRETPKQPFFSQRPCYPSRHPDFCLPIAYINVL